MTSHEPFLVLDRSEKRVLYEANSLGQACGYCDASDNLCFIATVAVSNRTEWKYRIHLMDKSGQILCSGPVIDLYEAEDLLCSLRVVVLPADRPENAMQHIPAEEIFLFDEDDDDDGEGEDWKGVSR